MDSWKYIIAMYTWIDYRHDLVSLLFRALNHNAWSRRNSSSSLDTSLISTSLFPVPSTLLWRWNRSMHVPRNNLSSFKGRLSHWIPHIPKAGTKHIHYLHGCSKWYNLISVDRKFFFSFYHLKSNVSVFLLRRQVTQSSINQYSPPVHEYCYGIPEQIMPMLTLWQHHILKIKQSINNICVGNKEYCICKSF